MAADVVAKFDAVFDEIVTELTTCDEAGLTDVMNWMKSVLEYNVPHGKKNRGMVTVQSYLMLVPDATDDMLRNACVLGWCVELLQAYLLVADDVMDQSETRRGRKCWYKNDDVGLIAINDGCLMRNAIFKLLSNHFRDMDCYIHLVELLHETNYQTVIGQSLDVLTSNEHHNNMDLSRYSKEKYDAIVKYKTAYYSFYLPVALAMHLANLPATAEHEKTLEILLDIGRFFQIQDDFLDCYGEESVTGKQGTDIENGKCCWPIVTALLRADSQQRSILKEHYGKPAADSVAKVREVYEALKLREEYADFEKQSYDEMMNNIASYPVENRVPAKLFETIFRKIYKRVK